MVKKSLKIIFATVLVVAIFALVIKSTTEKVMPIIYGMPILQPYEIAWQDSRPLAWTDFTGSIDYVNQPEEASAQTSSGIKVSMKLTPLDSKPCRWGFSEINIAAVFNKDKSWIKNDTQHFTNDGDFVNALKHEQGHFDITEIYARILKQRISEDVNNKVWLCPQDNVASLLVNITNETHKIIDPIKNKIDSDLEQKEIEYDMTVGHGTIPEKQNEWNIKIDGCLNREWKNQEDCWG